MRHHFLAVFFFCLVFFLEKAIVTWVYFLLTISVCLKCTGEINLRVWNGEESKTTNILWCIYTFLHGGDIICRKSSKQTISSNELYGCSFGSHRQTSWYIKIKKNEETMVHYISHIDNSCKCAYWEFKIITMKLLLYDFLKYLFTCKSWRSQKIKRLHKPCI